MVADNLRRESGAPFLNCIGTFFLLWAEKSSFLIMTRQRFFIWSTFVGRVAGRFGPRCIWSWVCEANRYLFEQWVHLIPSQDPVPRSDAFETHCVTVWFWPDAGEWLRGSASDCCQQPGVTSTSADLNAWGQHTWVCFASVNLPKRCLKHCFMQEWQGAGHWHKPAAEKLAVGASSALCQIYSLEFLTVSAAFVIQLWPRC